MRMVALLLGFFLVYSTNALGEDQARFDAAAFYREHALKSDAELERCAALLSSLSADSNEKSNETMKREGCYDDSYSGYQALGAPAFYDTTAQLRFLGSVLDIRIEGFDRKTGMKLAEQLRSVERAKLDAIKVVVIDLRDDRGGSVLGARDVLEQFAPESNLRYMQIQSRCGDVGAYQKSEKRGVLAGKQYFLLVDEATASASELIVGTMRYEWYPNDAIVVGIGQDADRTFGKFIMQSFSDENSYKITCGKWPAAGKHELVQGVGIPVDKKIPDPECDLEAACIEKTLGIVSAVAEAQPKY